MDPGQFGAVGGRDRRADRTVALSYTDAVTQTACWEERSQVCDEIRRTLAEVRRRTPSAVPAWGPRGTTPRLTIRGTTAGAPPPPPPPPYFTSPHLHLHLHLHLTSPHLTSPHLTSPHLTSPHLTSPHLTSPHLTSPHLTSPHLTSPNLISPHLTSPHLTSPPPHLTSPHLTSPHPTSPHLTPPHLTSPHLTSPHLTSPHLTSPHLTSPHLTSPHHLHLSSPHLTSPPPHLTAPHRTAPCPTPPHPSSPHLILQLLLHLGPGLCQGPLEVVDELPLLPQLGLPQVSHPDLVHHPQPWGDDAAQPHRVQVREHEGPRHKDRPLQHADGGRHPEAEAAQQARLQAVQEQDDEERCEVQEVEHGGAEDHAVDGSAERQGPGAGGGRGGGGVAESRHVRDGKVHADGVLEARHVAIPVPRELHRRQQRAHRQDIGRIRPHLLEPARGRRGRPGVQ